MLEVFPNFPRLLALNSLFQRDNILEIFIEIGGALPILSQMIRLNIPWLRAPILTHLEHLILLVKVYDVVVC